jgi:hypothetical protein
MANEAHLAYTTGSTIDGYVFRRSDGYVWYPVGAAFEVWGTNSRTAADYQAISMDEAASGYYVGDFPSDITTEAQYDIQYRVRAGANPANTDTIITPVQSVYWTGSSVGENTNTSAFLAYATGTTIDGYVLRRSDGYVYYPVGEVFEAWGTSSRDAADYDAISMAEGASGAGYYIGDFPSDIVTQVQYDIQYRVRAGADPADSDTIITPLQEIYWEETDDNNVLLTALANYALAKIGGGGETIGNFRIDDIADEEDKTAVAMLGMWPQIRRKVIIRAFFASATKYADLGDEVDVTRADWEYAFNLPTDYLGKAQQIWEDYHRSSKHQYTGQIDKEIVQRRLFTNTLSNTDADSAYIRYVFDLTQVNKFDPLLYDAIAVMWAAETAPLIRADGGKRRMELLDEYESLVLPLADGEDALQSGDDSDKGEYSAIDIRVQEEFSDDY